MAESEEKNLEKEAEQIEAELGEDHLVHLLQCLTSNSPDASQRLLELHSECRNVISKKPPIKSKTVKLEQKQTISQGPTKAVSSKTMASRTQKVQPVVRLPNFLTYLPLPKLMFGKPRIMMTKQAHSLVPRDTHRNIAA
ncbi:unnamed protein product [Haemonchus placei]|uniref:Mitotic-spindle organizing protein 2-like n=1 Tax=Haemonchus placei TaxID=6290 RepID=A0A0N4WP85_HAEPC|nr:unnamed protein product [Haemonchus placei]